MTNLLYESFSKTSKIQIDYKRMNSQEILARIPARHTGTQKEPNMYAIGVSKHGAIHFHMEIEGELYITTLRVKSTAKSKVKLAQKLTS